MLTNEERAELVDLDTVPCGCPACDAERQPGHFACEAPPDWVLAMERAGKIVRNYDDGAWRWHAV